jgi:hypoxanthine phosphoribosyltransferase
MKIKDKTFVPYLSEEKLQLAIGEVAATINRDFQGRTPVILAVLNGAFMFTADLIKMLEVEVEISFVKIKSYEGTQSSGEVKQLLGLDSSIQGKDVILLEDIVDTGRTICHLVSLLEAQEPASISTATLLFKPEALQEEVDLTYVAICIPNVFVVGYGLDYEGLGRQYREIYQLAE